MGSCLPRRYRGTEETGMSATILLNNDTTSGEYEMFEVHSLDAIGAVLVGPLFLEVGEKVRLRIAKGKKSFEVKALIHLVDPAAQRMEVRFEKVDSKILAIIEG